MVASSTCNFFISCSRNLVVSVARLVRLRASSAKKSVINSFATFVAVSARRGEKSPNFELLAANEVCRGVLAKKGGNARLSEWMKDGFARAVSWRNDAKLAASERAVVLRLAPRLPKGVKAPNPAVEKAWSGMGREKDLVAASLMDYLTFGPGAEKLGSIMSSMVPTAGIDSPTFVDALRATEWMIDDLDRSWREWVAKGSVAAK